MLPSHVLFYILATALSFCTITARYDEMGIILFMMGPLLLFVYALKENVVFPRDFVWGCALFFISAAVSTVFSAAVLLSVTRLLLYASLILLFIWIYNMRNILIQTAPFFLTVLTVVTIAVSVTVFLFPRLIHTVIVGSEADSIVYILYNPHNLLGDFLLIPCIMGIVNILEEKERHISFLLLLVCTPFFILSLSRSAFLALIVVLSFLVMRNRAHTLLIILFLVISVCFTLLSTREATTFLHINPFFVSIDYDPQMPKPLLSMRDYYFHHALLAFLDKPLLGLGPGSYPIASYKYMPKPIQVSPTSHNIFLDILAEQGIFGEISFLLLLFILLKRAKKNCFFWISIALLVDFSFMFSFQSPLILLFFILSFGFMFV